MAKKIAPSNASFVHDGEVPTLHPVQTGDDDAGHESLNVGDGLRNAEGGSAVTDWQKHVEEGADSSGICDVHVDVVLDTEVNTETSGITTKYCQPILDCDGLCRCSEWTASKHPPYIQPAPGQTYPQYREDGVRLLFVDDETCAVCREGLPR